MRKTALLLTTAVALLALGACKPKDQAPASSGASTAEATPAAAPTRKPGLWRVAISNGQAVAQTFEMCIDAASDKRMSVMGAQMTNDTCAQHTMTRQMDGSWSFTSVCDMGSGGRTSSQGTASGDFSSHYVVHADSVTEGAAAPQMNGKHSATIDTTWTGPCPAGQVGGDMTIHGMKINMLKAMKAP